MQTTPTHYYLESSGRAAYMELTLTTQLKVNAHIFELSGVWLGVDLRMGTMKTCVENNWSMCSIFVNYFRLNNQHKLGGKGYLYNHLMSLGKFHFGDE